MLSADIVRAESARYTTSLLCIPGLWSAPLVWRDFAGYLAHRGWESHLLDVRADLRMRGKQPEIGIGARRARMIVARSEMCIRLQPGPARRVLLPAQQQGELGVRLQAEYAVDDLRARLLEPLRPVDIRLLVEARHQLDDHRHFLAATSGIDQRFHQHRVDAGAVDSLLDRDHVGVVGGLADELDDRLK